MKCENCGQEFEGTVCPNCGNDAQTAKRENSLMPKSPKKRSKKGKDGAESSSEFGASIKKNRIIILVCVILLIAIIAVSTSVILVYENNVIKQVEIGMSGEEVKKIFGEPDMIEPDMIDENNTLWVYCNSKGYKKLLEESNGGTDRSEELAALVHNEIRIRFFRTKVYSVELLKDYSEKTKDVKKEIKKAKLSVDTVRRFETLGDETYAVVEYKDGSYRNAPVVVTEHPDTHILGETSLTWHDVWSDGFIKQNVTVIPNPDIYLRGRLPGTEVRYIAYETGDGYALSIFGKGEIILNAPEYPWDEIKKDIKTIQISNGISLISSYAFQGCSKLTSVTIPDSVASIGSGAFENCGNIKKVKVNDIAAWCGIAFENRYANPLTYANSLYLNEFEVKELAIPNTVTSIGDWAFYGCDSLQSIAIGNRVTSIGDGAFSGCSGLETITVAGGNPKYFGVSNCIIDRETKTLVLGCKNSIIPTDGSVTSIGEHAFDGCSDLQSIAIPNGVTSIGDVAFYGCGSLQSIEIPDSVTSIGNSAFSGCSSLQNIIIPDGVTSIGDYAFSGCSSLTSVAIPNGVTSIGDNAFSGCSSLQSITIPQSVTSISFQAFSGCSSLQSITIPQSVTSIGSFAFYWCYSLTSIAIPNSVTSIGYSAFEGCSSLTSIAIPDSVTSIGFHAFFDCSSLQSIAIPDSVTIIGDGAFSGCSSLTSIEYQGTKAEWKAITKGREWNYNTGEYTVTCADGTLSKTESAA